MKIMDEGLAKKIDAPELHSLLYQLAFLQNNMEGMAKQVAWSEGKPGEDVLLSLEANTAASFGQMEKSREHSRRAVASAQLAAEKETAAAYESQAALCEGFSGTNPCTTTSRSRAHPFDGPGCAVWSGAGSGFRRGHAPGTSTAR